MSRTGLSPDCIRLTQVTRVILKDEGLVRDGGSPYTHGAGPSASRGSSPRPLRRGRTPLGGGDGLIYFSMVSWSVSALMDSLDLDISHFGVQIMKTT